LGLVGLISWFSESIFSGTQKAFSIHAIDDLQVDLGVISEDEAVRIQTYEKYGAKPTLDYPASQWGFRTGEDGP
jgi:hypothetical protein